ncbi:MAG: Gfo/Idh/MocA family oxidoreductase [Oscillospiraceae bacterium]|nr:Gfo/Idh/MocA family oxidoreductase [Oscillospiraceae bacterium]
METVRVGIVGIGNMGSAHSKNIALGNIKGLTLAAVCDINPRRIEWCHENLGGIPTFDNYTNMLNEGNLDAVIIATPHWLHPPMAIEAFANGLHVLIEKPAGVMLSSVQKMSEIAEKSGKVFCIMWNQRTNLLYAKVRDIIGSGRLGKPKRLVWNITNWYRTQSYYDSGVWRATWKGEGGGVLLNQAPHNLDLWQWIFGMPSRIRAFCYCGKYHNIEVEDDATIFAEYENGATALFITSTGEYPGTNRLEISGDRGKLVAEDGKLKLWQLRGSEREMCFSDEHGFPTWETDYSEQDFSGGETAHSGIMQNFANAILNGERLLAPGIDGEQELMLSNAAFLSSWTDDWVTLPIDCAKFNRYLANKITESEKQSDSKTEASIASGDYSPRWSVRW